MYVSKWLRVFLLCISYCDNILNLNIFFGFLYSNKKNYVVVEKNLFILYYESKLRLILKYLFDLILFLRRG